MNTSGIAWPDGARCAALITFNLDAGLFLTALHPGERPESTGIGSIVDNSYAFRTRRLLDILEKRGVRATFFVPGSVAAARTELVREIASRGHEIAVRGWAAENLALLPEEEQRRLIFKSANAVREACGKSPAGFRMPDGEISPKTLEFVYEAGMSYSSSLCDDDRPYAHSLPGGAKLVEIPAHWSICDMTYFTFNFWPTVPLGQDRIACFRKVLENWKWEYDAFFDEGLCWVLQLDPYASGEPGHVFVVEDILDHIAEKGGAWFATCAQVADFCAGGTL